MTSFMSGAPVVLGLVLAAGSMAPAAPASEWKPFGLQGLTVRSLAAAPNLLCAGTQGSGVYCRDLTAPALGTAWKPLGPAGTTVTWLWIDPVNPLARYAACGMAVTGPSLYRTMDGGRTWVAVDGFPNPGGPVPRAWAVHGVPGTATVYAAGWTVWVSHDLGSHWAATTAPAGLDCLEVSGADPAVLWSGGETMIFSGFTIRSLDGGGHWETVWDSRWIGDNQTSDVAAHPAVAGLALTGHEGFVLRTENDGATFAQVLSAPSRFFLDWDGGNPQRAWAAGSPNGGTCHAFASRDLGRRWTDITGTVLAPRTVFRLEGDDRRTGVVYVATDTGVYRYYGGGVPVCLDSRAGLEAIRLRPGACSAIPGTGPALDLVTGDVIAVEVAGVAAGAGFVSLGEVECLVDNGEISLASIDTPDPAPGRALAILARYAGATDYGHSSSGLPRRPALGDCP